MGVMINILLDCYEIDSPYLQDCLKKYIKPNYSVAVVAFSFRDSEVKSLSDWNRLYGKKLFKKGKYYDGIVGGFLSYGISEKNITFINYFTDTKETAAEKIKQADIIYFTGGAPERMAERIKEFDLTEVLKNHNGIVMGYSAGAVIQLSEYHLSPDDYYKEFNYYEGLGYLDSFYLEVHYANTEVQNDAIKRVLDERQKTVYALADRKGAIVADNGNIKLLGDVKTFTV